MKKIYFALIHPHIIYGIELYANTYEKYLDPLVKLNNKLLKIAQFKKFNSSTVQIYSEYNTLPICYLNQYHILLLMHRYEHDRSNLPVCFRELVRYNRDIHDIQTRQSSLYHLNAINTKFGQKSLRFVGPKLWNNLPYLIKLTKGIHSFKKALKKYSCKNLKIVINLFNYSQFQGGNSE